MSKFLSYEDRLVIAKCLQENASFGDIGRELGKDRTTIAKEVKNTPTIRKVAVRGIHITPAGSVLPVNPRKSVATPVLTNQLINAASVRNAPCTVPILRKKSVL